MERVGIDTRVLVEGPTGGMTPHLRGVLRRLFDTCRSSNYFLYGTVFNHSLFEPAPPNVQMVTLPIAGYSNALNQHALENRLDVLFRSYPPALPAEPMIRFPFRRQVVFIPDLQHEDYPNFFAPDELQQRRKAFDLVLSHAGAIGTNSHHSRQKLSQFPATRCRDIFLMPPALSKDQQQPCELTTDEQLSLPRGDFFLYPANLWPHKNHARTFQAFEQFLRRTGRTMELVCTGHPSGWEALSARYPGLPIRHLGFVRPALLRRLLSDAVALVFFSLYEGFGMPLLEAFDAGTPVVCSNTTSLPEVGGNAVLSCDPTDVAAMAGLLERIVTDVPLRAHLVSRGKERLEEYSWERSAQELASALSRVSTAHDRGTRLTIGAEPPLVSIVTPSFNQGRFLRRTIDSVLRQTYPHIEYVVIDGGSTDESVKILQSYGDRFPWVSEKDRGQTHAINKGFARTRGAIRAYLNSDDVLHPEAVARAVAHFGRRPQCDLLYGFGEYLDEEDRFLGEYKTAPYSFERMLDDCCICQPAAFWRTSIADRVGPFDESLRFVMDFDYWLRIDRAGGGIEFVPQLLGFSRLYAETKTLSSRRRIFEELLATCQRHAGRVPRSHFEGLWAHRVHEATSGWPRWLRAVPRADIALAVLHWGWINGTSQQALRLIATRALSRVRRLLLCAFREANGVRGVYRDNWLGPECEFPTARVAHGRRRLVGSPAVDGNLSICIGDESIATIGLKRDHRTVVHLPESADREGPIRLRFSHHAKASDGRSVAFQVADTNLFCERDVA